MYVKNALAGQRIWLNNVPYIRAEVDYADPILSDLTDRLARQDRVLLLSDDGNARIICVDGFIKTDDR